MDRNITEITPMTTSNDYQDPTKPNAPAKKSEIAFAGDHWFEMTATLCPESTARLGDWIDEDLAAFEAKWSHFVTAGSLQHSRRR